MTDHEKFKSMLRAQDQAGLAEYGCKEPVTPREIVFWVRAGIGGSHDGMVCAYFREDGSFDGMHWED